MTIRQYNQPPGRIALASGMGSLQSIWRRAASFGQPRMGQDRYGRRQGAVVTAGERDGHAAAHRDFRPKSIGQVLQLRRSRISLVKGARRSLKPQKWIRFQVAPDSP